MTVIRPCVFAATKYRSMHQEAPIGPDWGRRSIAVAVTEHGAVHSHTYPRTPKMNAHCERFNRTVQEEFVDVHEELLFYYLPRFNDRLLTGSSVQCRAPTPHPRLQTPLDILAYHIVLSAKVWPNQLP